jgi:hypothetical protein
MVKFSDDHKKEINNDYFEIGIHKVQIMLVVFSKTDDGREYVEFTVTDPETQTKEGKARLWFTTDKAIGYTFNAIRGIFVHNSPEDKKEAIRKKVDAVKDTDELDKLCQLLVGKEAWYEISEDDIRTYQNEKGETKSSLNKNITGYKPTPRKIKAPTTGTTVASSEESEESEESEDTDEVMAGF